MVIILFSLSLIVCSIRELINQYRLKQRKTIFEQYLNSEQVKSKKVTTKNKNVSFEKIIAKNSVVVGFLRRFQDENIWKVYAVIIFISLFFILNQIINLIEMSQDVLLIIFLLIVIAVIFVPERIVRGQIEKRIKNVSRDLPLIVDIIAIMIKSGMTIENSFTYLSTKVGNINKDIQIVLERACLLMAVNGVESAIDLIYRDVPSKEMRMFCVNLKRSIKYGNSIYDSLLELSTEMREMQKLDIEEKIASISAKMTVPMMLFILFPVLVVIGGPIIMRLVDMF